MKKKIVYLLIFIVAIIFQLSIFPVLLKSSSITDSVLMMILAWSIIDGFSAFILWSIIFGLLYDFFSYSRVGIHVIIFLVTAYCVSYFSRRFSIDLKGIGILLFFSFVIVISLFSHLIISLCLSLELGSLHNFWLSFGPTKEIFIQLIFNMILFYVWFNFIKKTKEFFLIEA